MIRGSGFFSGTLGSDEAEQIGFGLIDDPFAVHVVIAKEALFSDRSYLPFNHHLSLDSVRYDIVDKMLTLGFGYAVKLFVAFPKVEKQTKRHQPNLINT